MRAAGLGAAAKAGVRLSSSAIDSMRALRLPHRAAPRALSAEQVAAFDRDGFVLPHRALSEAEAAAARARIEAAERASDASGNSLFVNGHLLHRWQYELATHPALLGAVADLLGPNLYVWKSQLWIKEASSRAFVGWHQDAAYWGLAPHDAVNAWVALSDVREEHGPMRLLAGSHAAPLLPTGDNYEADNMLTRGQVIPSLQEHPGPDPARTVAAVLAPGECSLHHLRTAHGGGPNNHPSERRIGFNVTYCAGHVASRDGGGLFVRGAPTTEAVAAQVARSADRAPPAHGGGGGGGGGGEPTAEQLASHQARNLAMSRTLMEGADMEAFARVSEERRTRNLPPHVSGRGAAATSLAASLLAEEKAASWCIAEAKAEANIETETRDT